MTLKSNKHLNTMTGLRQELLINKNILVLKITDKLFEHLKK